MELNPSSFGIEIAVTVAIRCAIEALLEHVALIGVAVDVALLFQLAEVIPVHNEKFSVIAGRWHDIVTLACLFVGFVCFYDSGTVTEIIEELIEYCVHNT